MSNIIFTLVSRGFGWNLMREIFTSLDGAIFSLFSAIIQLMFDIVRVTASDTFFNDIQSRIYVVLSIYMLFKVTISLITYVVNPDSMSDKGQGVGKLVQRIMISMVMLIAFPMVFEKLTQYQSDIIESGTIDNIILGSNSVNDQQNAGDGIGVAVYDGFIIRLKDTSIADGAATGITKVSDATDIVNLPGDTNDVYKYEYIPLIGFALGVLMTLLILSFCIDLAIRVFKLIILQLIAPIPIISYIDPKASKDGAFSKWIKMVGTTWASLFVRLVVIDFILLLIKEIIGGSEAALNIESGGIMVKVALIIGLLFFAKNLPKFIGDALGIKIEGGLFAGLGQIAAAGAIGLGALGTGIAVGRSRVANGTSAVGGIFSGIGASVGSLKDGIMSAGSAKDHQTKAAIDAINKNKALALSRSEAGSTVGSRMLAGLQNAFGLPTSFDTMDAKVQDYEAAQSAWKRIDAAMNSDNEKFHSFGKDFMAANGERLIDGNRKYSSKEMNDLLDRMKSSGAYTQSDIESVDEMKKALQAERFDDIRSTTDPSTLTGPASQVYSGAETIFKVGKKHAKDSDGVFAVYADATSVGDASISMGKDFKGAAYNAGRSAEQVKNSPQYIKAKASKNEAQKK